jgi:cyclohexadieny/prephenate dehydrogenase
VSLKAALIGTGYIGGSLAAALKRGGAIASSVGCDLRPGRAEAARARGLIDQVSSSAASCVEGAELVILAVPVGALSDLARAIGPALAPGALVIDVGSVKAPSLVAAEHLPEGARMVATHPIAGHEHHGPDAADPELFVGRLCMITPTARSDQESLDRAAALWRATGAEIERIEAAAHDALLAATSHLPHVAAFALAAALGEELARDEEAARRVAGGSLRDGTRVAGSDAQVWRDIFVANRGPLGPLISRLEAQIAALGRAIAAGDGAAIEELLDRARLSRARLIGS